MLTKCYWLDAPHERVMIGATKVLIGRSPDCAIVLEGPQVSRYHVVVRLGEQGAEMLPLGREPVLINGVERRVLTSLRAGDVINVCGWTFRVGEGQRDDCAQDDRVAWFLERQTGLLHYITGPTYRVGGDVKDDLIFVGWEPSVFALDGAPGPPVLTALRPGVWCGRVLAEGERVALQDGSQITYREGSVAVRSRQTNAGGETRPSSELAKLAVRVVLEFRPRGGQLTLEIGGKIYSTLLSDRRCDMVACLLQPPAPFCAGELIPEEVLCARVWPGEKNGRTELNTLLYRLRHSLAEEGIDPSPLFERQGGGLRFCLAPGATVVVR